MKQYLLTIITTFQKVFYDTYLLFFKIKKDNKIDFSSNLILVYDNNNNSVVYYNIKTDKIIKSDLLKNNNEYKKYYYVLGKWTKENLINLEEN